MCRLLSHLLLDSNTRTALSPLGIAALAALSLTLNFNSEGRPEVKTLILKTVIDAFYIRLQLMAYFVTFNKNDDMTFLTLTSLHFQSAFMCVSV